MRELLFTCLGVILAAALMGTVVYVEAWEEANKHWQTECVKRGVAEYNATTGKWQWKESEVSDEQNH